MIETERLFIRPFTHDDAEALLPIWSDPANERFVGATPPRSVEDVLAWWKRWLPWGVWELGSGELVGDCGLSFDTGYQEWELSYGLRRDRWGRVSYTHYTARQLHEASDRLAWGLQALGVGRGTRTVLMVKPSLEFFALTFALFKLGAVPVFIDPAMGVQNLGRCLAELNPAQARVVVLKDALGLSFEEISAASGMPVGTAKCYAHRGRKKLRSELEDVA